jgi:large subunit ribosomal protein L28
LLQDSDSGIKRASLKDGLDSRLWVTCQSVNCKQEAAIMSKVCQVTGKRPMAGNNVSHAKNRTRRRFEPNLHTHRFWIESEKRFVKLRVSTKGMRIIDKNGIENVLASLRANGEKI